MLCGTETNTAVLLATAGRNMVETVSENALKDLLLVQWPAQTLDLHVRRCPTF
jgi:hypothetical protein